MHFFVGKAITVALMGLGNVLLTTTAAPAEIVRARDPNVPDNHIPHYSDYIASLVVARSPKGGKGDSEPKSAWSDSSSESSDSSDGPNPAGFGMDNNNPGTTPADGPNPGAFGISPPKDGSNSGSGSRSGNPPIVEGTVDLKGKGYDVTKKSAADGSTNIEIRKGGPDGAMVVDMSVNGKGDSYTIKQAWNNRKEDPNKPSLGEMVHSIWVNYMGKNSGDLNTVRILSIIEETTQPVFAEIKKKKGSDSTDYTFSHNSKDSVDKGFFDQLTETAWGKHVQKVLRLGGDKKEIKEIKVQGNNLVFNVGVKG